MDNALDIYIYVYTKNFIYLILIIISPPFCATKNIFNSEK